jgi:hypothetical protein
MHGIRGQQGQDAHKEKPPMPAEDWPNVLQEPGDGKPHDEGECADDGRIILLCDAGLCKDFVTGESARLGKLAHEP